MEFRESREFLERVAAARFGTGQVRIVNTEILDDAFEPAEAICWGRKAYYRIHMRVDRDTPFLAAGFMIRDGSGRHILGDESWACRVPMLDLHAGDRVVLEFSFDVNFAIGEYTITPACSHRNVEMVGETSYFDWIDNCDILKVPSSSKAFHAIYHVDSEATVRVDRCSGQVPEDLHALVEEYEAVSHYH